MVSAACDAQVAAQTAEAAEPQCDARAGESDAAVAGKGGAEVARQADAGKAIDHGCAGQRAAARSAGAEHQRTAGVFDADVGATGCQTDGGLAGGDAPDLASAALVERDREVAADGGAADAHATADWQGEARQGIGQRHALHIRQ